MDVRIPGTQKTFIFEDLTPKLEGQLVGGWTTHLKNMLVKLDHFPNFRGENSKNIWNHLVMYTLQGTTLPETNSQRRLKIGRAPKGNNRIPAIYFQGPC